MNKHAKFSPSAAHRWLKCTASVDREADFPGDQSSDAADRGTLYHAVAEVMLRRLTTPASAAPKFTKADLTRAFTLAFAAVQSTGDSRIGAKAAHRLMNKDEAEDLVVSYVRHILENYGAAIANPGGAWGIEARLDISYLGGEVWGTADFWCHDGADLLVVDDLKTGRHPVSPEDNPQAILYALGALASLPVPLRDSTARIQLVIHQGGEPRVWDTDPETLFAWERDFVTAIKAARAGGELRAGDWCRFCKARQDCGAYADRGLALAQQEFGDVPVEAEAVRQTLLTMPGNVAAEFLNKYAEVEAFMKSALDVLAQRAYAEGLEIPGYKVIRGAKRKAWDDPDKAGETLGPDAYKPVLMTPAQAIKKFGDKAVEGLWTLPVGEIKLVTEATRGTPVTRSAAVEFADTPVDAE